VIGEGTCESFVSDVGIRRDVDKDNWYSANAIYQLFLRQAEMDARLEQVLRYQDVQQLTSMIYARIGLFRTASIPHPIGLYQSALFHRSCNTCRAL